MGFIFSKEDINHLTLLLWRIRLALGRKKGIVIDTCFNVFLYLGFAIIFRLIIEPVEILSSDNFDNIVTIGTQGLVQPTDPDIPAGIAQSCIDRNFTLIGLVDETTAPGNPVGDIYTLLKSQMTEEQVDGFQSQVFTSEEELEKYQKSARNVEEGTLCFALVLNDYTESACHISLRYNQEESFKTDKNLVQFQSGAYDMAAYNQTRDSGIYQAMGSVTSFILKDQDKDMEFSVNLVPTYTEASQQDPGDIIVYIFTNLCLQLIAVLGPFLYFWMLEENEGDIFSLSKSMGLKLKSIVGAVYVLLVISVVLLWIPTYAALKFTIYKNTDMSIIFIALFLYSIAQVQSMVFYLLSSGSVGIAIFLLLQLSGFILQAIFAEDPLPGVITYIMTIFSPGYGFGIVVRVGIDYESRFKGEGLSWNTADVPYYENTVLMVLICLAGCFVLMSLLTFWLWPVFQVKEGQKLNICYCLSPQYYAEKRRKRERLNRIRFSEGYHKYEVDQEKGSAAIHASDPMEGNLASGGLVLKEEANLAETGDFELPNLEEFASQDTTYMKDTLRIHQLFKQFEAEEEDDDSSSDDETCNCLSEDSKPSMKTAVDNLSLSIYKNQILALLGHNGAGKTTTISMLTGFLKPDGGHAKAFGLDVFEERDFVDKIIGICPQNNVIVLSMTVMENLYYFCGFRGMSREQVEEFANEKLAEVSLDKKKNALVSTLSGGQKRKLQLLIAIAGDTKVILLDEPSSGMDPTARRDTWDLIQRHKQGRIIILTTHYMDEADHLGDRIAIMSKGQLKCCGSSLFLKKKFGLGIILEIQALERNESFDKLEQLTQSLAPEGAEEIKGKYDESNQYVIKLPEVMSSKLKELFAEIDRDKYGYNVDQYNVRVSSLEEVFNNIGEQEAKNEAKDQNTTEAINLRDIHVEMKTVQDDKMYSILWWRRSLIGERKSEIWNNAVYSMLFSFWILWTIVKSILTVWKLISVNDIPTIFNEQPFTLAQAPNFVASPEVPIASFISSSSALQNLISVDLEEDFSSSGSVKEAASAFSLKMLESSPSTEAKRYIGGLMLTQQEENNLQMFAFANQSAPVASQSMAGLALEAIVQNKLGKEFNLTFTNNPLPPNALFAQASLPPIRVLAICSVLFSFLLQFSNASLNESFRELESGIRKQLLLSGVEFHHIYWTQLAYDISGQAIACGLFLAFLRFADLNSNGTWLPIALLAIASPVFNQFFLALCKTESRKSAMGLYSVLSGLGFIGAVSIAFLALTAEKFGIAQIIEYVLCVLPNFAGIFAFIKIVYRAQFAKLNQDTSLSVEPWGINGCLPELIGLGASIVIYPILTFALELNWLEDPPKPSKEAAEEEEAGTDERVKQENQRAKQILDGKEGAEQITVVGLKKEFKSQLKSEAEEQEGAEAVFGIESEEAAEKQQIVKAVKGISFSLKKKECFILLGVNGAGKSTTFKCLTAEEQLTSGDISIGQKDIREFYTKPELMRNLVGYCPQTDPIIQRLTVKENLELFAKIKGVPEKSVNAFVVDYAKNFRVFQFMGTQAGKLSGGNKRKLCTAIAMMGNPSVIFLDESSAGVDPYSRRLLWKTIRHESRNSALVVTTHSMEEAEALGTKIAIMVDGRFKCFGTGQQLKEKYGQGFEVEIKLDTGAIDEKYSQLQALLVHQAQTSSNLNELLRTMSVPRDCEELFLTIRDTFENEFNATGLLSSYFKRSKEGQVDVKAMLRQLFAITEVLKIAEAYEAQYSASTGITDYKGDSVILKLSKAQSIGHLFGFSEGLKQQGLPIREYSAKQTSLEQVFNMFAKEQAIGKFSKSLRRNSSLRAGVSIQ